ncbi:MAG: hypothetical protein LBP56_06735 [Odoribacteraceae bacterium]|jgi:hypothetical protein|nr:hypothetical protein [Odoribacteraceae bacterium]
MNHKLHALILALCVTCTATCLHAQAPVLNVSGDANGADVYLQALDVRVEVTGNIATTIFTMTFKNRTARVLEGELVFPLPDGSTVSHYALDINGKMREAVAVEKAKATRVFEEIERRRVDPGLLERVAGNNFRSRVYPIPAHGTRVISVGYEQELPLDGGTFHYRLPMDYREPVDRFSLKATVRQSAGAPRLDEKLDDELTFDRHERDFIASFSRERYLPPRGLAFSLPAPLDRPGAWMQPVPGSHYFMVSCLPALDARDKRWADHLGIIWDASLSGLQRDIPREMEIIDAVVRQKGDLTITLHLLNNRFSKGETFRVRDGNWEALRVRLDSITYDGGTNYEAIVLDRSAAREYLFFSDGLATLSDADFSSRYPVHCLVSSPRADYSALKWIAARTGGKFINLNALSREEASKELISDPLRFLGVEAPATVREVYPSIATPVSGYFSVTGILDAREANITLLFGRDNKVEQRVRATLRAGETPPREKIHRLWAQKKIAELDIRHDQNREEIITLGTRFGIVTRETSLIVLETAWDYVTYNITPPKELREQVATLRKRNPGIENRRTAPMTTLVEIAIQAAKELQRWWGTTFPVERPKYPRPDSLSDDLGKVTIAFRPSVNILEGGKDVVDVEDHHLVVWDEAAVSGRGNQEQVFVTGSAGGSLSISADRSTGRVEPFNPRPEIRLVPVKQDNDYINDFTGNATADYATYLSLRPGYINTPAFYFHVADHFYRLGDRERALDILTCLAEIDLENATLARALGYRLREYGEYPLALHAFRQVTRWRPLEPQGYRDVALTLADAGRAGEALDSLHSLLKGRFEGVFVWGVSEVVVTEINQLLAMHGLKADSIDKRLVQPMPVDIRVVLNWNMNNTDIDLHVTDPRGETCYYGNPLTAAGGRVSSDITTGYGPEQFMIKKALPGKYEVFVNYFDDSKVKNEGPTILLLEIYTRYSDKRQEHRLVCLQLEQQQNVDQNGLVKIAEFEF